MNYSRHCQTALVAYVTALTYTSNIGKVSKLAFYPQKVNISVCLQDWIKSLNNL